MSKYIVLTEKEQQIVANMILEFREGWSNLNKLLEQFKWTINGEFDFNNEELKECSEKFEQMNIEGPWVY